MVSGEEGAALHSLNRPAVLLKNRYRHVDAVDLPAKHPGPAVPQRLRIEPSDIFTVGVPGAITVRVDVLLRKQRQADAGALDVAGRLRGR